MMIGNDEKGKFEAECTHLRSTNFTAKLTITINQLKGEEDQVLLVKSCENCDDGY